MNLPPAWPAAPTRDPAARRRRRWILASILAVVLVGAATSWSIQRGPAVGDTVVAVGATPNDSTAHAPTGVRVRVRVLNASGTRGLARRAALELRDRGFDVVDYDSERGNGRSTSLIQVHTAHADWAARLRRGLGVGSIESTPDSLRFVDLTVYLGRDWHPSTEALRP